MNMATMGEERLNRGLIALIVIVATIGGFMFGYDSGVINGTQDGLKAAFGLGEVGLGIAVAALLPGCAVGAFMAGLALSQSDFGYRALSETVPLKDVFGALFFVSLGMLADPRSIAESPEVLLAIVAAIVVVKVLVLTGRDWVPEARFRNAAPFLPRTTRYM